MNHATDNNICPVCGYDGLEDGTASGEICSSCGTEFGYSDSQRSNEQLRQRWINERCAQWWSFYTPAPLGWSAVDQLRSIGHECTATERQKIAAHARLSGGGASVIIVAGIATNGGFVGNILTGGGVFRVALALTRSAGFPTVPPAPRESAQGKSFLRHPGAFSGQESCLNS